MLIFRDVCPQGEVAECPDEVRGFIGRHRIQRGPKAFMRGLVLVLTKADGHLANRLDPIKHLITLLRSNGISEQSSELADITPK
jgi:hypothetical protein